ncbi:transcriptional regulator [Cystobacter ferrugineus]|uniref:Transcriptional regulator n=2 Tax=Cystobacter ferrugineus TaxID=83449 RepID=A0A1L9B5I2_9BACT|nr:transcriptional regulator [Cystobacter ferrugineus]
MTRKKLTVHLGEALRAARARAQWTQADVAERVGVATEVYGRMERGNLTPSVPILRALCGVLRMDADEALALESRGTAAWLKEQPAPEEESPQIRRLMRALRLMDDKQLAALSVVARTLASSADE